MGICESSINPEKPGSTIKDTNNANKKNGNLFCAPVYSFDNGPNIYNSSISQTTTTIDRSQMQPSQKPPNYIYVRACKKNGLQNTLVKASLVNGNNNSFNYNTLNNSNFNNNTIYSSIYEDVGSISDEFEEYISEGKMDEDLVLKSHDKNIINNYNEYIIKKEDGNKSKNNKILDYYCKNNINKNNNLKQNRKKEKN